MASRVRGSYSHRADFCCAVCHSSKKVVGAERVGVKQCSICRSAYHHACLQELYLRITKISLPFGQSVKIDGFVCFACVIRSTDPLLFQLSDSPNILMAPLYISSDSANENR